MDFSDIAARYAQARMDQATQPFTDPQGYLNNRLSNDFGVDTNGNVVPKSTTISYDDNGQPASITQKHDIVPSAAPAPTTAPTLGGPVQTAPAVQSAPQFNFAQPQQMTPLPAAPAAQPVAPAQPTMVPTAGMPMGGNQNLAPNGTWNDFSDQSQLPPEARMPQSGAQPQPAVQPAPISPAPVAQPVAQPAPTNAVAPTAQPAPAAQPAPEAAPQPAPIPGWASNLIQGSDKNSIGQLASLAEAEDTPPEIKKVASERLSALLKQKKEEEDLNKTLTRANSGDVRAQSDLTRYLSKRSEEGSYVKAILFARLGLNDLAKEEQAKLSKGGLENTMLGGDHYTIERNPQGGVTRAWNAEGQAVDENTLSKLNSSAITMKGVETGKSLYKTPDGTVYSFSTVQGRPGGIWTNMATQETSSSAPKGITPFGQQDPVVQAGLRMKTRAENDARIANNKAGGRLYTEEQIRNLGNDAFKSATGYNYNPQVHAASSEPEQTGYVPNPGERPTVGAVEQNVANQGANMGFNDPSIKIISAQRTWDQQNKLYQQSVANGTPGTLPNGVPVAPPGASTHETGNALDIDAKTLTKAGRRELAEKGWYQFDPAKDPNHWERVSPGAPTGPAPTATPAQTGINRNIESQAAAIANYEAKPLTAGGAQGAYNQTVMARARELNPNYDETKWATANKTRQAFTTGKQGDTVRSMNVAVDHLNTLSEASQALNNGQLPILNKIMNEFSKNTGHPAVTNFDGIKSIVGSEVAKAVSGAGGSALGDREEIRKEINAANSPQQLAGVIKKYQDLMVGQLKGLKTQYEDSGLKDFDKKLSDPTKRVLNRVEKESKNTRSSW